MRFFCLVLLCWLGITAHAVAQTAATDWQQGQGVQARLLSSHSSIDATANLFLGLDVQLQDGWDTYWRTPGDAGFPPKLHFEGSQNIAGHALLYPRPIRMTLLGLETIGYKDSVLFPIVVTQEHPGKDVQVKLKVTLLVCKDICVPNDFLFALSIPSGAAAHSEYFPAIEAAQTLVPTNNPAAGIEVTQATRTADGLLIAMQGNKTLRNPELLIESDTVLFGRPEIQQQTPAMVLFLARPANATDIQKLAALRQITVTALDDAHARVQFMQVSDAPGAMDSATQWSAAAKQSLPLILLIALIGGLILNLMPCVLPVLSLKVMALIGHADAEQAVVRRSFLVTSAGILFSFMLLAGFVLLLRAGGHSIGWGVQFQHPLFIVFLSVLLLFFAANMLGLFEINLPAWLSDKLSATAYHPRLAGDFFTGAFSTLLATPCTAPFLGTAVGFALAAPTAELILVFLALGIGMALPYGLIAAFPAVARCLPKPGAWMTWLRKLLGLALLATIAWLLLVLSAETTTAYTHAIGIALLSLALSLIAWQRASGYVRMAAFIFVLLIGATSFVLAAFAPVATVQPETRSQLNWQALAEAEIPRLVKEGKTVLVDVTAAWCLTCKANEHFVLEHDDIRQALTQPDIVLMRADWTNHNPAIATYLQKHGRFGIPFNMIYGPGVPQGQVLPELLTKTALRQALQAARGQSASAQP